MAAVTKKLRILVDASTETLVDITSTIFTASGKSGKAARVIEFSIDADFPSSGYAVSPGTAPGIASVNALLVTNLAVTTKSDKEALVWCSMDSLISFFDGIVTRMMMLPNRRFSSTLARAPRISSTKRVWLRVQPVELPQPLYVVVMLTFDIVAMTDVEMAQIAYGLQQ